MPNILVFPTPPNNINNSNKTLNCTPAPAIKTTNTSPRQLIMHTMRYEYIAGGIDCSLS